MAYKMKRAKIGKAKSTRIKRASKKIKSSRGLTGRRGARY